jgi:hypothetical protein
MPNKSPSTQVIHAICTKRLLHHEDSSRFSRARFEPGGRKLRKWPGTDWFCVEHQLSVKRGLCSVTGGRRYALTAASFDGGLAGHRGTPGRCFGTLATYVVYQFAR